MQVDMHRGPKDGSGIGGFAWDFVKSGGEMREGDGDSGGKGRVKSRGKERNDGD